MKEFRGPDFKTSTPGGIGKPKRPGSRRFRVKASPDGWKELRAAKLGPCVVCRWLGVQQGYRSSLHHVVAKSLGGSDVAENLVPVCGDGTRGHHFLLEAHHRETCRAFAAAVQQWDDAAYVYAIDKLGEHGWLRRYCVQVAA